MSDRERRAVQTRDAPVSSAQRRILFLQQLQPGSSFYTTLDAFLLRGPLDIPVLAKCVHEIVARHEILRTVFLFGGGEPVQRVLAAVPPPMPIIDLRGMAPSERQQEARRLMATERAMGFSLVREPPVRFRLLTLGADEAILLATFHHVAMDGWSLSIFARELHDLYDAFVVGLPSPLRPLRTQYAQYSLQEREWEAGDEARRQLAFWEATLSGAPDLLTLPADRPRPAVQSNRGAAWRFTVDNELTEALLQISRGANATLYMTLLAAFTVLLQRLSGQDDIIVGGVVANRGRSELFDVIGFFANSVLFRTTLTGDPSFERLLTQVRRTCLDAYANQSVSADVIARRLFPERDLGRNPLYQVNFTLHNMPPITERLSDLTIELLAGETDSARFDLDLNVLESSRGLECVIYYATDLFEAETVARFADSLTELLAAVVADPRRKIRQLPVMAPGELHRVLREWNEPRGAVCATPLHELVERRAATCPSQVALTLADGSLSMTLGELDRRANQFARYLAANGARRGVFVAVLLSHAPETVAVLLAILKTGAAYLPLDAGSPPARLAAMMDDSDPLLLVTRNQVPDALRASGARVVSVDEDLDAIDAASCEPLRREVTADDLAYLIYTSGSSGTPKAAMLSHRNVVNYVLWAASYYAPPAGTAVAVHSSLAVDLTVTSIFLPLVTGATMILPASGGDGPGEALREVIGAARQLSFIKLTPSHLRLLEQSASEGRLTLPAETVVVGGEALYDETIAALSAGTPGVRIVNEYGPTETAVACTAYTVPGRPHASGRVPIGVPVRNTLVYVVDRYLQPVSVGVRGELCVGGAGVGYGYWGRPKQTAERFVPDPFSPDPGARMYRTGDAVRWLPSGELEYLGRDDSQVKLRGHRIELGEIESVLGSHAAVRQCAAQVVPHSSGEQQIVAVINVHDRRPDGTGWPEAVQEWRKSYEGTYSGLRSDSGHAFNLADWTSSYNGRAIAEADMAAWLADTVERIQRLRPRRVAEIGCGTGMVLLRLKRDCESYVGTDTSRTAVEYVRGLLSVLDSGSVEVHVAAAHDGIPPLPGGSAPDTIILNSVLQYFPSVGYAERVIGQAVEALAHGGHIFIGDVRSLPLLELLHTSVEAAKAPMGMRVGELRARVKRRVAQDAELCIHPGLFPALAERFPKITDVRVLPKAGRYDNELSRFRYDVVLTVDEPGVQTVTGGRAWSEGFDAESLRELLKRERPSRLSYTHVPNARLAKDLALHRLLWAADPAAPVGQPLAQAADVRTAGIHPQDLWDLEKSIGYDIEISWLAGRTDGSFDVAFTRPGPNGDDLDASVDSAGPVVAQDLRHFANDPLWRRACSAVVPEIAAYARERLPEPMLPARYVVVPAIPLSPSGKVDRLTLRELAAEPSAADRLGDRPLTETEQDVGRVWCDVLGCDDVGPDDDFFAMGGHSLLTLKVVFRLRRMFGIELPARTLFDKRTLAALAAFVDELRGAAGGSLVLPRLAVADRAGPLPLSSGQERLWFMDQLAPGDVSYNVPAFDRIFGPLDVTALARALDTVLQRHEILRTAVVTHQGQPCQRVRPHRPVELPVLDLCGLSPGSKRDDELKRLAEAVYRRPFDLASGSVLRGHVVRLGPDEHVLLLCLHHSVHDDWSYGVLISELSSLYAGFRADRLVPLPPLAIQYGDFAVWQRKLAEAGYLDSQLEFWKRRLRGVADASPLPTDHARPARSSPAGRLAPVTVPPDLCRAVRELCRQTSATLFTAVLAAWSAVLQDYTGSEDIVVGTDVASRPEPELEKLIGFFVNQVVLRMNMSGEPTWQELLDRARVVVLDALRHQDLPFERLVEALNPRRTLRSSPLFQAKLVMTNTAGPGSWLPGLTVAPLDFAIIGTTRSDLGLILRDTGEGIAGVLEYRVELFEEATITRLISQFVSALDRMVRYPHRRVRR
jgi:amino acid adenylation domain-containing protein